MDREKDDLLIDEAVGYEVDMELSNIWDIWQYNPYRHIYIDEYFEEKFLEYYRSFKENILRLKEKLGHKKDRQIDNKFLEVVRTRNSAKINEILHLYQLCFDDPSFDNQEEKIRLRNQIRVVKDIILATEPADMKRMAEIDEYEGLIIDRCAFKSGLTDDPYIEFMTSDIVHNLPKNYDEAVKMTINELIDNFDIPFGIFDYQKYVSFIREKVKDVSEYYRKNFSVETASKYIQILESRVEKVIEDNVKKLNLVDIENQDIYYLKHKYQSEALDVLSDGDLEKIFEYITLLKEMLSEKRTYYEKYYSKKYVDKLYGLLSCEINNIIDMLAKKASFPKLHENEFLNIINSYKPEDLNIFDIDLYSSEEERGLAILKYRMMSEAEKKVFEMRMYEQYIRVFRGKIRSLNKDIRRVYSDKYANEVVASNNRKADKLISKKAKEIGRPVPKNPWLVRKYLYADTDNFMSENGLKFRKFINPLMRQIVKFAMDNKIIIEERPKLDSTKKYIFVSTHYFTEDVIGLFSSLGRQAYMLMGTTDQIENNPLMLAAVLFGFFHVDRMDSGDRVEAFEKQNKIIEAGGNFINYVGGSWENSENELQPLSFSGPYRTSILTGAEIVPVASYLVREENKMYVRFGEPMDLSCYSEEEGNEIIRDTLASMHYKQLDKYSFPIGSISIDGYGMVHDLPYDQHTYYMEQVGNEYWHQPWTKPFALEEIGLRKKKEVTEEEVYKFIDNLSREKLIELSSVLAQPLVRMEEKERYDIISYIDRNYDKFKSNNTKKKVKNKSKEK